jgi:hypothetical protein
MAVEDGLKSPALNCTRYSTAPTPGNPTRRPLPQAGPSLASERFRDIGRQVVHT